MAAELQCPPAAVTNNVRIPLDSSWRSTTSPLEVAGKSQVRELFPHTRVRSVAIKRGAKREILLPPRLNFCVFRPTQNSGVGVGLRASRAAGNRSIVVAGVINFVRTERENDQEGVHVVA